jgi:hypothetical protein
VKSLTQNDNPFCVSHGFPSFCGSALFAVDFSFFTRLQGYLKSYPNEPASPSGDGILLAQSDSHPPEPPESDSEPAEAKRQDSESVRTVKRYSYFGLVLPVK